MTPIASKRSIVRVGPVAAARPASCAAIRRTCARLPRADRVERPCPRRPPTAPRLDLAEHQHAAVEGDDVELAPAGAVVALDDLEAAAGRDARRRAARPSSVRARWRRSLPIADDATRGSRDTWVTQCANSVPSRPATCAELARAVTHGSHDRRSVRGDARPGRDLHDRRGRSAPGVGRGRHPPGLPAFTIVGLGDTAVRESRDRIRSAILNSGFKFPARPDHRQPRPGVPAQGRPGLRRRARARRAGRQRAGAAPEPCAGYAVFGELSLGGELRDSPGALAVAEGAHRAGLSRG